MKPFWRKRVCCVLFRRYDINVWKVYPTSLTSCIIWFCVLQWDKFIPLRPHVCWRTTNINIKKTLRLAHRVYFRYFYGRQYKQLFFSLFETFAMFWMLYSLFLVIIRRLNFMRRRFGTLCLFHLPSCSHYLWKYNRQGVPKRRHIQFRSRGIT